jgi:hypothetical protein
MQQEVCTKSCYSITSSGRTSIDGGMVAERLGGLDIDDHLEPARLFDGDVGGLARVKILVHLRGGSPIEITVVRAIGYEATGFYGSPILPQCTR